MSGRRTLDDPRSRLGFRGEENAGGAVVVRSSAVVKVGQTQENVVGHRFVLGEIFLVKPHCLALYKDLARASTERASVLRCMAHKDSGTSLEPRALQLHAVVGLVSPLPARNLLAYCAIPMSS